MSSLDETVDYVKIVEQFEVQGNFYSFIIGKNDLPY